MKHVSILLLHDVNISGLENARQVQLEAKTYLKMKGLNPNFQVKLVGLELEI